MKNQTPQYRPAGRSKVAAAAGRLPPGAALGLAVLLAACGADERGDAIDSAEVGKSSDATFEADAIKDTTADVGIDTGATAIEPTIAPDATAEALDNDPKPGAVDAVSDAATGAGDAMEGAVADGTAAAGDAWTSLQANWADSVDEVKAHFGELSEEDILNTGGDRDRMVGVVQERYRLEPAEAERQVADWEATL